MLIFYVVLQLFGTDSLITMRTLLRLNLNHRLIHDLLLAHPHRLRLLLMVLLHMHHEYLLVFAGTTAKRTLHGDALFLPELLHLL